MTRIGGTGGEISIPELTSDPVSPAAEDAWVLRADTNDAGTPIGLLLSLTYAVTVSTYQLSYRTHEGTTIRAALT